MKMFKVFFLLFFVAGSFAQVPTNDPVAYFSFHNDANSSGRSGNEVMGTDNPILQVDSLHNDSIQVHAGWNLISLPVSAFDDSKDILFPNATSQAFIFQNGYQSIDTMEHGSGFWLKFDSTETIYLAGNKIFEDAITLHTGWNIIGSLSTPVAVNMINSSPPGIFASGFYKYDGGYTTTDTIYPGEAYWIKTSQDGFVTTPPDPDGSPCTEVQTVLYEGKTYNTVQIGKQCWLKENLDVGTKINSNLFQTDNGTIEKYCYANDIANCQIYGGLYRWDEAMQYSSTSKSRGICPVGWHIPTRAEFTILQNTAINDGNALKAVGQGTDPYGAGTNAKGFSALLAGGCENNYFNFLGYQAFFWSSTENAANAQNVVLNSNTNAIYIPNQYKSFGYSVRCIKDDVTLLLPTNGSTGISLTPTLEWSSSSSPVTYTLQVSTKSDFSSSLVYNQSGLTSSSQNIISGLINSTKYYWRVNVTTSNGTSDWSTVWCFFTEIGGPTNPCTGVPTVNYGGKTYNTVQIGNQCWLKENLDVGNKVDVTQPQTNNSNIEKYCYSNDIINCQIYGGLYQWNEAMQYNNTLGTKGICPNGWHIPTDAEFQTLQQAVSNNGNNLKAKGQGTSNGAGTNNSGFSALLAGYRSTAPNFIDLGTNTYFWSAKENAANAQNLFLTSPNNSINITYQYKTYGFNVRCIKDPPPQPPTLSLPQNGSVAIPVATAELKWNTSIFATSYTLQVSTESNFSNITHEYIVTSTNQKIDELSNSTQYYWRVNATNSEGTSAWCAYWSFTTSTPCASVTTVNYADKTYNTVQIGNQCWLKENLDVGTMIQGTENPSIPGTIEKYCYANVANNCNIYGGLYQWNEAMQYSITEGTKGICPTGWHIPTLTEFSTLKTTVSSDGNALKAIGQGADPSGAGTNNSGFSALLAGYRSSNGNFAGLASIIYFCSSTMYDASYVQILDLQINNPNINLSNPQSKTIGFSVRCIKNPPPPPTLKSPTNGCAGISVFPTLEWNESSGAISYTLQVSANGSFNPSSLYNLTSTSQTTSELNPSTPYYWRVKVTTSDGTSPWSSPYWVFITSNPCASVKTVNYAEKTYNTVQIGNQCWLKENLDIGDMIPGDQNQTTENGIEKYCYGNVLANCIIYGGLYQWDETMQYSTTEGTQGICPTGWHIPTSVDFQTLRANNSGSALRECMSNGFSALFAGYRTADPSPSFTGEVDTTYFWNSKDLGNTFAQTLILSLNNNIIDLSIPKDKKLGSSVRCIKNEIPNAPTLYSPLNGAPGIAAPPTLEWSTSNGATSYTLQVSIESDFSSYDESNLTGTSQTIIGLSNSTQYYWRVSATNSEGTSAWSTYWSFTTSTPCVSVTTVNYADKTYNTVQIGNQCWLKENLDVGTMIQGNANPSIPSTIEKYCYNNVANYCNIYGGLYQWNEAMQYIPTEGTQGICPPGWHIPTHAEFQILSVVNGNDLKAFGQGTFPNGSGTNNSGFSALLAGYRSVSSSFGDLGHKSYFWSSTILGESNALYWSLDNISSDFSSFYASMQTGYSIRCIKDPPQPPTIKLPQDGSGGISVLPTLEWNESNGAKSYTLQVSTNSSFSPSVEYNTLTSTSQTTSELSYSTKYYWRVNVTTSDGTSDWSEYWSFTTYTPCAVKTVDYEGKTYNTVQIGNQCWLKENLDAGKMINGIENQTDNDTIEKFCYDNDIANCQIYGGLYQWDEAMKYVTTPGTQGICPPDWRIPTYAEFQILSAAVSNNGLDLQSEGINTSGFSALLAGSRSTSGSFAGVGVNTSFWSSTELVSSIFARDLGLTHNYNGINLFTNHKVYGFSVRCLKNDPPPPPTLISPPDGSIGISITPTFIWNPSFSATSYVLQVSTDLSFFGSSLVYNEIILTGTSQTISGLYTLINSTKYYWRVIAENSYGSSESTVWWFFTDPGGTGNPCPGVPTVNYVGKIYNTLMIGYQCWLKENLDVGTMINGDKNQINNDTIEKYCYDNDPDNCIIYGGLYQWNEAMQYTATPSAKGICPSGWHIPSSVEFGTLTNAVNNSGNKLKAVGQGIAPDGVGTNDYGFSALLAGLRTTSIFVELGTQTSFLSSTLDSWVWVFFLWYDEDPISRLMNPTDGGYSIRCLKDDPPLYPTPEFPTDDYVGIPVQFKIYWNSSEGATTYTLQVSADSLFSSYALNQSGITDTSQEIAGLSHSSKYYWHVNATNSYGTSTWSECWSFTTAPQEPTLSSPPNGSVGISIPPSIKWNTSGGATSYALQVSTDSSFLSFVYNQSGLIDTSQQITGLNDSTKYYWRVNVTTSYGTSEWSSRWSFTTGTACTGTSTVTYAGKIYHTVPISAQCWLKENLDVGTRINGNQNQTDNSVLEKYCYNNDTTNCNTYGGFYQWNEAMQYTTTPGTQGICPTGWHLPTYSEFQTLAVAVSNSGNALKEVGQGTGGGAGTNTSGFSALLSGYRTTTSTFSYLSEYTMFWSSTEYNTNSAYALRLDYYSSTIHFADYLKTFGFCVRCVKD